MIVVDQGNTQAKICQIEDFSGKITDRASVKIPHDIAYPDFVNLMEDINILADIEDEKLYLSSVVKELTPYWIKAVKAITVDATWDLPLKCSHKELRGTDRLMMAVAVSEKKLPAIIVSLGTATVVDAMDENKEFLGGMIAPGIVTAMQALGEKASQLFCVNDFLKPESPLVKTDTRRTIESGIFYHTVGSITCMVNAAKSVFYGGKATVYLTGGMAEKVAPHLPFKVIIENDLVLRGIYLTAKYKGN